MSFRQDLYFRLNMVQIKSLHELPLARDTRGRLKKPQRASWLWKTSIELPPQAELRLETIATLAVRMRETVRRLSEEWEAQSERAAEELHAHPN